MKRTAQYDEVSPTYHGTTRDVPTGALPAFLEPFIFPRYLTDATRETSYLEDPKLIAALAEQVLACYEPLRDWQRAFDAATTEIKEFPEVRRRVLRMLPEEIQQEVLW